MRTTPAGLADLARAFSSLNPTESGCEAIASLLGLKGPIAFGPIAETVPTVLEFVAAPVVEPLAVVTFEKRKVEDVGVPRYPSLQRPPPAGWRYDQRAAPPTKGMISLPIKLTEVKRPAAGGMPPYVADAEELNFERGTFRHLDPPEALVPQEQLRALIGTVVSAPVPGEPDVSKLVDALAQGRLPRVLPRKKRKGIAARIHVLIDTADAMRLFHKDSATLMRALRNVAGPAIQSEQVTYGPPSEVPVARAARGDMLLIVSDLGIGSRVSIRRSRFAGWRNFATVLRSRGIRLIALVPFHYQRWPADLSRLVRMVHWHRPGAVSIPATNAQLHRLAVVLSIAAVIDPALLRRARKAILPAADGSAEADFASGRWTAVFNPRVIGLDPAWVVSLRSELASDPELLEQGQQLLKRPLTRDWDRIVFEEEIVQLSLQSEEDCGQRLKSAFARVIRTLVDQLNDKESARWALCLLEELPQATQRTEAAQLLKAVASVILNTSHEEYFRTVSEYDAKWIFNATTPIGIFWTGEYLMARDPPLFSDRILEVPDTWPRVLIVEDPQTSRQRVLRVFRERERGRVTHPAFLRVTDLPLLIKTADGGEYQVDRTPETWQRLLKAYEDNETIEGVVKRHIRKRGYWVDIGLDALLPDSEIPSKFGNEGFIDSTVLVRIININRRSHEITVGFPHQPLSGALLGELLARFRTFAPVEGLIVSVGSIGYEINVRGEAITVPFGEFPDSGNRVVQRQSHIGEVLSFVVVAVDEERRDVTLSRRFDEFESWKVLLEAARSEEPIQGTVLAKVKGGFHVDVGQAFPSAFVPSSLSGGRGKATQLVVGQAYDFVIDTLNWSKGRNIILSRRKLSENEFAAKRTDAMAGMRAGQIRKGIIKNITDYGVFVDLGGVDGLLHIAEVSWGRINHPSEYFKVGDEIEVVVMKVEPAAERVSLGYKQMSRDPWADVVNRYPIGSKVNGRVVALKDYGAFIALEKGVEGLIHISEMSWTKRVRNPSKLLTVGADVDAVITEVNVENRRISLSLRALQENPWGTLAERYAIGTVITGKVSNVTDFGVFVEVEEGIDGLIHISDLASRHYAEHLREMFHKDDVLRARVIGISVTDQRINLSVNEFLPNHYEEFAKLHSVGDEMIGTIRKITDFGVFVRLAEGIEGLLHKSEIVNVSNLKIEDMFQTGDSVRVRIIRIDREERKIGLSIRDEPQSG